LCIEILTLLRGKIWLFKGRPFIQVEDRGESVTGRVQKGYGSSAGQVQNGCKREAERVQRKTSIYDPGAALTSPEAGVWGAMEPKTNISPTTSAQSPLPRHLPR